jgi:cysteine desulfurase/selenocysteine lyase
MHLIKSFCGVQGHVSRFFKKSPWPPEANIMDARMNLNDTEQLTELFPVKRNYLYFNFAADGPLPTPAKNAVFQALEETSREGMMVVDKQIAVYEHIRRELSLLFNSRKENFAFTKNTSEGILLALLALDLKENENYIAAKDAFPTTIRMMENNCKGEMRTININSPIPIRDQLLDVIDKNTKVIVLDWVHFFTGKIIDIEAVTELARSRDIFTIIDGIQGAGAVNIHLDHSNIDFFVSAGHKWMLAPQGSGFIYVSPRVWEKIQRRSFGWLGYDWGDFLDFDIEPGLREGAAVMEYGTRSYSAAVGFRECLKLINRFGIKNIEAHNQKLKAFFIEQILEKGYETILNEKSASIVPFRFPDKDPGILLRKLAGKMVRLALRNGYIRAAFHFMNDPEEVKKLIDFL